MIGIRDGVLALEWLYEFHGSKTGKCPFLYFFAALYNKPMLDITLLRENSEKVKRAIATKNANPALVDTFLELDNKWREATSALDDARALQNEFSRAREIEKAKKNKEKIKELESRVSVLADERDVVWMQIPNMPNEDAPIGKDESENKVFHTWGEPTKFTFPAKDHVTLGDALGVLDIERAGQVSGSRFAYLKGDLALLEFAIVQYTFKMLTDESILAPIAENAGVSAKPFIPVVPPAMIRPEVFRRMGRLGPDTEDERYYIPKDDLYLIGSAEHTLGPLHMDEILDERDLPIRYIGFSTSFRREAGSYGKDVRGILRVHQFDKLEMESFTLPENSKNEQKFIVGIQEYLMQSLGIPYRVVDVCTGDMGGPDERQIDIEAWMPGQGTYRETHTSDLMGDYQARRLNTKVRRDKKIEFAHMNDATAFAIGRILIAIMENYQTKEGNIRIPNILQSYVGKEIITSKNVD